MLVFVGVILVVVGLIHFYLWKRLVKDPLPQGPVRRVGTALIIGLAVLIPVTLIGSRSGFMTWQAWPGYLWLALMFYLLVTLAVLELPRLVIRLAWRSRERSAARQGAEMPPMSEGSSVPDGSAVPEKSSVRAGRPSAERPSGGSSTERPEEGPSAERPRERSAARPGGRLPAERPEEGKDRSPADRPRAADNQRGDDGTDRGGDGDPTATASHDDGNPSTTGARDEPGAPGGRGIERRLLLARGAAIFAGLTAAGVTGYGVRTALGPPRLDRLSLPMAKLPRTMDGTRLAVVSDIHLGPLTGPRHATRIVELINSVKADIVCVVGDLVDGSVAELGRFAAPLADIESRYGAFFVTGNHEYYSGYEEWVEEVARLGLRPLRNERVEIGGLDLAGVNDLGGTAVGDGPDLARALGDRDPARPVVLMAHQPVVAHEAAPFGVDLQVSGHTHGGQMAPFNLLVRAQQPLVSGLGEVDGVPVYVTNGAGWWGPPVRVGAPPQVSVIELRP